MVKTMVKTMVREVQTTSPPNWLRSVIVGALATILVPFHLGWRGLQNRRAGFESRKEPRPAPWLTAEQNELVTTRHAAGGASHADDAAIDGRAGLQMIEIFAAVAAIERG